MADNDAQLELKKRARRRLVGAIALALAAAIVLPMVMDSEPKSTGNELQIRIPSQEGGNFASRMISGAAQRPAAPQAPTAQSNPAPAPSENIPPDAGDADTVAAQTDTQRPEPPKPAKEPAKPTPKPNQTDSKKEPPKESAKPVSENARALSILEGKEVPPAATKGSFFVQLGVYRDEANAHEVLSKAKSSGIRASAEKIGDKTRLRVGPFTDRAAAESVVAKLKKAGLPGIVTSK